MTALMRVGGFVFHNVELVERELVKPELVKPGTVSGEAALAAGLWEFAADACHVVQADHVFFVNECHGHVNVFKNLLRGDTQHAVGRFDEVVTPASGMLAAEGVGKIEIRVELFCLD